MVLKGTGNLREEVTVNGNTTQTHKLSPEVMGLLGRIKGEIPRGERVIQSSSNICREE